MLVENSLISFKDSGLSLTSKDIAKYYFKAHELMMMLEDSC